MVPWYPSPSKNMQGYFQGLTGALRNRQSEFGDDNGRVAFRRNCTVAAGQELGTSLVSRVHRAADPLSSCVPARVLSLDHFPADAAAQAGERNQMAVPPVRSAIGLLPRQPVG